MKTSRILMSAASILLAIPAFAADEVRVVSGGIGGEERATIEAQQAEFPLKVLLIGKGGMYLSDVAISIKNEAGEEVVSHTAEGPIVLVDLLPGKYEANFLAVGGAAQRHTVTVTEGKHQVLHVRFPDSES